MAYLDYIPCCECKEKLIYDGSWEGRERLEERYGTTDIMCPKCLAALRARLAEPERGPMSSAEAVSCLTDVLACVDEGYIVEAVRAVERHHGIK